MALYVTHPSSHRHDTGPHPENASRLRAIDAALAARDWLGMDRVEAPAASLERLERVHAGAHVAAIRDFCEDGGGMLDLDTVASRGSWEAALHAAGGAAWAAERLLAGDASLAVCALRPPGHHAERARAMGFCLFNNVAVAAAHALAECGAERVLVLDWDVHHGNGTEAIFAGSDRVLYTSIHEWPLYPGTGPADYVGEGEGTGFTVNLPVAGGSGSEQFCALVEHVVAPLGRAFAPDLVAISAGFDAHRADPLASCSVDEAGYAAMAATVRDLARDAGAPVLVCLEGGYDVRALADSLTATIDALDGDLRAPGAPVEPARAHLERVRAHWPALG